MSPPYPPVPRFPVLTLVTPPTIWSSCGCRLTGGQSGSAGPRGHWKGTSESGQHGNTQSCPWLGGTPSTWKWQVWSHCGYHLKAWPGSSVVDSNVRHSAQWIHHTGESNPGTTETARGYCLGVEPPILTPLPLEFMTGNSLPQGKRPIDFRAEKNSWPGSHFLKDHSIQWLQSGAQ